MNMSVTLKRMPTFEMQISSIVPVAGELIIDATSNKLKVGDGKTAIKDLPWVDFSVDSAKEESSLSRAARMFLENNIELIDNNDYDTLYSRILAPALAQEVTIALLKADLNPKPYLSKIPQSIRHILEPEDVWFKDTIGLYTKADYAQGDTSRLYADYAQADMSVIDEWNKKLLMQMSIPQSMIKVGN